MKIPEVYPETLEESLKIFEKIKYNSYGFPLVFLDYDYTFKSWSVVFRNPANFKNPDIKAKTPLEAVHQMFDYLKTIQT
jgi:hypothetical protein